MKFPAFIPRSLGGVGRFLFLFIILYTFFFILSSKQVFAQQTNPSTENASQIQNDKIDNLYLQPDTNPDVPKNMHTFTQSALLEIMAAFSCQISGIDPINPNQKCLGADPKTGKIGFVENGGGAIGITGKMIAMTFQPPLSTSDYFGYLAQNFGVGDKAYAAPTIGSGFNGIRPLINIWAAFRNIVYLIFILIFIIIGLLIMLRVKIDPRTVMTIENQLPKIIMAILLVTFSFPIAGLFIDIMWVSIYLIFNTIAGISPDIASQVQNFNPAAMQGKNALEAAGGAGSIFNISHDVAGSIKEIIQSLLDLHPANVTNYIPLNIFYDVANAFGIGPDKRSFADWVIDFISNSVATGVGLSVAQASNLSIFGTSIPTGWVTGALAGTAVFGFLEISLRALIPYAIAFLIISVAILWALLRLWFTLIASYIYILIDVVLAPFLILMGIFPGQSMIFGWWTRDMIANLSVYPVTILMFLLGSVFMKVFGTNSTPDQFVPPLIGSTGSTNGIGSIIGLAIILMTPVVATMMRDTLKAPQFKYAAAAGQALGVAPGVVGGSFNAIFSPYGSLATMRRAGLSLNLLMKGKVGDAINAASGTGPAHPHPQEGK